jgi:hypothetical protein
MTQISSNTLTYDQIYIKIREFYIKELRGDFGSNQERLTEYKKLISDIHESMNGPMTKFDPYIKGEPPMSEKFNTFAKSLGIDVSLLSKQVDYLNAKAINAFNLYSTEIEAEKRYTERIASKAKILQMYSRAPSEDLVYIGDSFDNADLVDISKVAIGLNPIIKNGMLTMPVARTRPWIPKNISIDQQFSNGFYGNNHQVIKDLNTSNSSEYDYVYQSNRSISSITALADTNPLTYFEYEILNVDKTTSNPPADVNLVSEDEFCYVSNKRMNNNITEGTLINWSNSDMSQPLKLRVVLENSSGGLANSINIVPYFGSSKLIKITNIKAYYQNGDTKDVISEPVYIGTSFSPLNLDISSNYFYNEATIKFTELKAVKFEIDFEQELTQDLMIKHTFFKPSFAANTGQNNPFYGLSRFNPSALNPEEFQDIEYDKYKLVPSITLPNQYKDYGNYSESIPVRLTRKPTTFGEYAIVIHGTRANASSITQDFYYYNGSPSSGALTTFNAVASLADLFMPDEAAYATLGNRSTFRTAEDGASELARLIAYLDENLYDAVDERYEIEFQNAGGIGYVYYFSAEDIGIEYVTYTNAPQPRTWTVPVSLAEELYSAKRKSIGIRDISVSYEVYADRAQIVSTPFYFDSPIESLMLSVESNYDNTFIDRFDISYYISMNDSSWIQISPIQLSSNGIAEVIVFNKNIPTNYQIPGVAYLNYPEIPNEANKVAVKIEMAKERYLNITPEIYSYQLMAKVKKQ